MIVTWRVRQVTVLGSIALVLLFATTLREISGTLRATLDRAQVEGRLVAEDLIDELGVLAAQQPDLPFVEIIRHPRISRAILDAQVAAPSVLHVAIYDVEGMSVVHTLDNLVGEPIGPMTPLPDMPGGFEALRIFWSLSRDPVDYATDWPLVSDTEQPIAVIRVVSGSAFLLHDTEKALQRGAMSVTFLLLLSLVTGLYAARSVNRRLRKLESSIAALREGQQPELLPESGWAEFENVVHELNLLGERFRGRVGEEGRDPAQMLDDGILVLDAEERVVFDNPEAWLRLGVEGGSGRGLAEMFPSDHALPRLVETLRQQQARSLAVPYSSEEGLFVLLAHRFDGPGRSAGVLVEVKAQRVHEEVKGLVRHSRVLERIGEMAAGVAHELRGPLQGLEFDLDALESSLDRPEDARAMLTELQEKIRRLEWVVSGFLKVVRARPVRMEAVSVAELVRTVQESLETEALMAGIEFSPVEGDPSAEVLGDRDTLARALENVISNAIEALPSQTGSVGVSWQRSGSQVEIQVADSGPGIEEDRLEGVFDLYFTTKPHGTGVGLALVRQAVDLHNGDVRLDSRRGQGTTVTLSLPTASLD